MKSDIANRNPQAGRPNGQDIEKASAPGERPPSATSIAADPFDLTKLRLSQDFEADLGVKKALLTVPVRKPDKQTFIRVHPDATYRLNTAVVEVKEDRETYLVEQSLWPELQGEVVPKTLFTAMSRQGVTFLWPVRLPGTDGRWMRGIAPPWRQPPWRWSSGSVSPPTCRSERTR